MNKLKADFEVEKLARVLKVSSQGFLRAPTQSQACARPTRSSIDPDHTNLPAKPSHLRIPSVTIPACSPQVAGWAMKISQQTSWVSEALNRARSRATGHFSNQAQHYPDGQSYKALAGSSTATFKIEYFARCPPNTPRAGLKSVDYLETSIITQSGSKSPPLISHLWNSKTD